MKNIIIFTIGIISLLVYTSFDIVRFKNKEYNPKFFRFREGSEKRVRELVFYFLWFIPSLFISSCFMEDSILRLLYACICLLVILITYTTFYILLYKWNKTKIHMLKAFILNIICIFLLAVLLIVY